MSSLFLRAHGGEGKDGSVGLARIVAGVLGRVLCKRQQMSPWQRRPLAPAQLHYAALDAHVLLQLATALAPPLAARGAFSSLSPLSPHPCPPSYLILRLLSGTDLLPPPF
jgi:hypothetical protein